MRVVERHSHLNGEEYLLVHRKQLLAGGGVVWHTLLRVCRAVVRFLEAAVEGPAVMPPSVGAAVRGVQGDRAWP